MSSILIAIDGFSACGKSTLARDLARCLDYSYIDTGAMYRAVTLFLIEQGIALHDLPAIQQALSRINIRFRRVQGQNCTFLNGREVEKQIRSMQVSNLVSEVAAISEVRRALVAQQQEMGRDKGVVLDGRDIGTVVFPDAELKIFLTAAFSERSRRRFEEICLKFPNKIPPLEEVQKNLSKRDHIDSSRADSPLRQADDARLLDNTKLNRREQLDLALSWVREITGHAPTAGECL